MRTDCGCGCGGTSARASTFVRPRFFAGQLLTEDDLGLLVDYVTSKTRLHNRNLSGPGVVCGLEVTCEPCGGGSVVVHPGHALDCAGNDIVLSCKEKVDVGALVRELRISSLGVDCGDPCDDDGDRRYGLFVRYEELSVEPVTPYDTGEPCASPGCVPSRIQEGFKFLVKHRAGDDHRHNPGTRLLESLGDHQRFEQARLRYQLFGRYVDAMHVALELGERPVKFDAADAARYADSLAWLQDSGEGKPAPQVARDMTEHVRALASAVARFDTYDQAGRAQLTKDHTVLGTIAGARETLATACERLSGADPDQVWPGAPLHRALALAVVSETRALVTSEPSDEVLELELELRLLAQGTPLSHALRAEFRAGLMLIRDWLLSRLDQVAWVTDCTLRADVVSIPVPQVVSRPEEGDDEPVTEVELRQIAEAAGALTTAVRRFLTDAACTTLNPPCTECSDTDVLLARVELDDCDVVRIRTGTREQVLPGGSAYGEWLPKLYRLRQLAERVCGLPIRKYRAPKLPADGPVPRPYPADLLGEWPRTGDLEQMLSLLLTPAPGETPPKPLHEQVYAVPSEVTDSLHELAVLRAQVTDLTDVLAGLRAQLGSAQEQVSEVREKLPERLGPRLEELERAPADKSESEPAKPAARQTRSTRAKKPTSGESS
jgi:hypothetical protein